MIKNGQTRLSADAAALTGKTRTQLAWLDFLGNGTSRRRATVLSELLAVIAFCTLAFYTLSEPIREIEAALITTSLHLLQVTDVANIGTNIIMQSPDGYLTANLTPSCSALLSILAVIALAASTMRSRGWHTVGAALAAATLLLALNAIRIGASIAYGVAQGEDSLILFHDWVGTIINFTFTLTAFIFMVWILLPNAKRAEQDRYGRHTAQRPTRWARPGLGYRTYETNTDHPAKPGEAGRKSPLGKMYTLMPKNFRKHLSSKREANRVDYRVGDLEPAARAAALKELASDGLSVHIATLWAAASYETNPDVLDALAQAVAARQWEPVVNDKVAGIRLWARAWTASRPGGQPLPGAGKPAGAGLRILVTGAGGPAGVAVLRRLHQLGYWTIAADADSQAVGFDLADTRTTLPLAEKPDYTQTLASACKTMAVDAVIVTTTEEMQTLQNTPGNPLGNTAIWLPSSHTLSVTCDKALFAKTMQTAGINHPATAQTIEDLAGVPGPWICKPRAGRGSRGVHPYNSLQEARTHMEQNPDSITQTRVSGREWTADTLTSPTGQTICVVPRWREETRGGISVKGSTFNNPDQAAAVEDLCRKVLQAVQLTGVACVQGFIAEEGTVTVTEVNPRFSGGLPLTLAAGADTVGAYIKWTLDPQTTSPALTWQPGVRMNRYFQDLFYDQKGQKLPDPGTSTTLGSPLASGLEPDTEADTE